MDLIEEVRKKREFSGLPNSVVERALEICSNDVNDARAYLRKYFGVFLTNKVMRLSKSQVIDGRLQVVGKGWDILTAHKSSAGRDYGKFYGKIFGATEDGGQKTGDRRQKTGDRRRVTGTVIDLGCGVNGFSYEYLPSGIRYVGVEASGQLVDGTNRYFKEEGISGEVFCLDLFDLDSVLKIVNGARKPCVVFLFQVIDALEFFERNYSKKFLREIMKVLGEKDMVVVSYRVEGLSGSGMYAKRKWLVEFLESEFGIDEDFEMDGERIILIRKK